MNAIKNALLAVWRVWKKFGEFMGEIVGRVFLMLFYITIALPFGVGMRLFSDPLDIRKQKPAEWITRTSPEPTIAAGYKQF